MSRSISEYMQSQEYQSMVAEASTFDEDDFLHEPEYQTTKMQSKWDKYLPSDQRLHSPVLQDDSTTLTDKDGRAIFSSDNFPPDILQPQVP